MQIRLYNGLFFHRWIHEASGFPCLRLQKSTELPVRIVTMVTDIWIQVFEVPLPDVPVPVMHNDIQGTDLKGLSAGSLLLRSYKCTCRNLNIFRFQELLAEEV